MAQYLKPDSVLGYIEDNAEIESLKLNNLRHVVLGCMLGDFNEVGAYVVAPEIVKELIAMEKHLVNTYDNIELFKGNLKLDKQITFMVAFEGNKATLSLVEKLNFEANYAINSGTYSNINEYVLDSVETSGEINKNAIYTRWNIKPFGGNVLDIFTCDESVLEKYFGIVNRFKYLLEANKILLEKEEEIEEIEAGYANDLLEILSRYPTLNKEVLKTIDETLTEKKGSVDVNKPYFAKTLNEVLENAIQKNIGLLDDNQKQEFNQEKRNAIVAMNIKREDVLDTVKVEDENEDKHQTNPKVVLLKTNSNVIYNSVDNIAKGYVNIYNQAMGKVDAKESNDLVTRAAQRTAQANGQDIEIPKPKERRSGNETSKLIKTLNNNNINTQIGITPKQEKPTVMAPQASDATKPKTATASSNASAAKPASGGGSNNKATDKKPAPKKAAASAQKKSPEKKPQTAAKPKTAAATTSTATTPKPVATIPYVPPAYKKPEGSAEQVDSKKPITPTTEKPKPITGLTEEQRRVLLGSQSATHRANVTGRETDSTMVTTASTTRVSGTGAGRRARVRGDVVGSEAYSADTTGVEVT